MHHRTTILRNSFFDDIELGHDFKPRNDRILEFRRDRHDPMKLPVDTHPDDHLLLRRLKMDIRSIFRNGTLNNRIDQADHRCHIFLSFSFRHLPLPLTHLLCRCRLCLHLRHRFCRSLVAIQNIDRTLHCRFRGDHRHNSLFGSMLCFLNRHEVQRIRHCQIKLVFGNTHRYDRHFLCQVFRHKTRQFRADIDPRQINIVNAQLHAKRIDQLTFRDIMMLDQRCSQTFFLLRLIVKRLFKLPFCDQSQLQKHVSQSLCTHSLYLPINMDLVIQPFYCGNPGSGQSSLDPSRSPSDFQSSQSTLLPEAAG